MRTKPLARKQKLRVDLHGTSVFGPGSERKLIRWEWITEIEVDRGVVIRSHDGQIRFPDGAFGLSAAELANLLTTARSIERRGEVIGRLAANRRS